LLPRQIKTLPLIELNNIILSKLNGDIKNYSVVIANFYIHVVKPITKLREREKKRER
jgi:hypothetical protein